MKHQPSSLLLLQRIIKLSLQNIWRNKLLSLATIFVIGAIIFIFNIILAINTTTQTAISNLSKKVDLIVYLKEDTEYIDIENLAATIKTLEGVAELTFTSKNEALESIKLTHPNISTAFEKYNLKNPLPASINIKTTHPRYHSTITDFLNQKRFQTMIAAISSSSDNAIIASVSGNLIKTTAFTEQIIFWLVLTFVIGGTLIILNALQITIFTRKKEIGIMKLVGAPHWFIRGPFITESIIYSILATALSFFILISVSKNLPLNLNFEFAPIFLGETIITIILGIISSLIATHEYLHKEPL
ncbi:FtsX-like permease family protein [Candidatus Peregrinibacteria bacterium]|nr:FtsX-like permease family protein [Candidatus Peregrinibacteria bacterium]